MRENILNIEDLSIWYRTYRGYSKVVDHINLQVGKGEKIGLVGESGCGKTTTMKTVMGVLGKDLIHVPDGKIDFAGKNVLEMKQSGLQISLCKWGYPLAKGKNLVINARVESVLDKPSFRNGILHHRVLIPASGFYEWNRMKEKSSFTKPDASILYMAGFYD